MSVLRVVSAVCGVLVASLMACGAGDPAESEQIGELADSLSGTVTIKAVHSGKCLEVRGDATQNGARLEQWPCADSDSQRFTLRPVGADYELASVKSGKCVDVSGVSQSNGAVVHQWDCVGGANQRWNISAKGEGSYRLKAVHSSKCLDVSKVSQDNGAVLHQWTCGDGANQRFSLTGSSSGLVWKQANLTNFTSYPDPGSDECVNYNGCTWAGYFAGVEGKQSEEWVRTHNILAVHSKDFAQYRGRLLRLKQGSKTIDATVYDMCSDTDCNGCCTRNAGALGFLIDVEKYTMQRFGSGGGVVDWACVDCN